MGVVSEGEVKASCCTEGRSEDSFSVDVGSSGSGVKTEMCDVKSGG